MRAALSPLLSLEKVDEMLVAILIFVIFITLLLMSIAGYLQTIVKMLTLLSQAKIAELKVFGGNEDPRDHV